MKRWYLILAVLVVGWGAPLPADDAERDRSPADLFAQLDKDGNGQLTRAEVPEGQIRFFERLVRVGDRNDDGQLSREEFLAAMNQPPAREVDRAPAREGGEGDRPRRPGGEREGFDPGQMFSRLDRNGDGQLSRDELPEPMRDRMAPLFERLGKETLSREDFLRAREMFGGGPPGEGRFGREMLARLREMDRNRDGKVTLDEAPEEARSRIREMLERFGQDAIDLERLAAMIERQEAGDRPGDRRRVGDRPPGGREGERPPMAREGDRPPTERTGERPPLRRDGDRPPGEREGERPRGEGERGPFGPPLLRLLDRNRDGRISRDEFEALRDLFGELDRNRDGFLDPFELFGGPGMRDGEGRPPFGPPDREGAPREGFRPPREGEGAPREGFRPPREGEGAPREGFRPPRDGDRPLPPGERPPRERGEGETRPRPEREGN